MEYVLSAHARKRMEKRGITEEEIDAVIQNPHEILEEEDGTKVYQALVIKDSRFYIFRVFIEERATPPVVKSIYYTSKAQYWE